MMIKQLASVAALVLIAGGAWAAETGKDGFAHTFTLGATLTEGNSETWQTTASLLSEGEKAMLGSVRAGLDGRYGESEVDDETEKTMETVKAFIDAKKTVNERVFGFLNTSFLYDQVADISYRFIISAGPGYYFVKNDATSLSAEVGPAYVFEEVGDDERDYPALRAAERFEHKFSNDSRVWQSIEYLPKLTEFGQYIINSEVGAEAVMNSRVNLRLVLQDQYNSEPADDKDKNDVTLIAGVSVKL